MLSIIQPVFLPIECQISLTARFSESENSNYIGFIRSHLHHCNTLIWFPCTEARDGEGRRRGSTSPEWKTTHLAVPIYPQYPGPESVDACDYFELSGHSYLFWGFPLMDRREFCLHYYLCISWFHLLLFGALFCFVFGRIQLYKFPDICSEIQSLLFYLVKH